MSSHPLSKFILSSIFLIGSNFASGSDEFTYDVIDGGAEITGCVGECPSDLVIPEEIAGNSVSRVGDLAFENNQLISVSIPNSVTSIGYKAFHSNQLTQIVIPDSITNIDGTSFANNQLNTITIGGSVIEIRGAAFRGNKIANIDFPASLTSIRDYAFDDNNLASLKFYGDRPEIRVAAFRLNQIQNIYYCSGTTGWPGEPIEGVTPQLDENCDSTPSMFTYNLIDGGAEVTGCVGECPNDLVIPEEINGYSVTSIGNEAFDNNELTSAIIPSSVQNIGSNAFTGNQLTSIDIPNSITSMFSDAFSYNQLTSISVPSGITAIDVNTFSFNNLTNVTIPRNISTIGDFAFEGNPLASVNFDGNRPQISSAFLEVQFETIYYCAGTTGWPGQPIEGVTPQLDENCDSDNDGVKNAQDAFPFDPSETLDTDLDGIGNNADPDDDNDGVNDTEDAFPLDPSEALDTDLDGIGNNADPDDDNDGVLDEDDFAPLDNTIDATDGMLTYDIINDEIEITGCLEDCPSDLVIPEIINGYSVIRIRDSSFSYEGLIDTVTLPQSIVSIEYDAFSFNNIKNVTIPSSVTSVGNTAFNANQLDIIRFIGNRPEIHVAAFSENQIQNIYYCSGTTGWPGEPIEGVTPQLDENCDSTPSMFTYNLIDGGAEVTGCVGECPNDLVIPEEINGYSVTRIKDWAFENNQLTSVTIPDSVTSIGGMAFESNQLTSVIIPSSVTNIENWAFANNQLTNAIMPDGVNLIGSKAFEINQLTSVTIPQSVTSIGYLIFNGNPIDSVYFEGNRPENLERFSETQIVTIYYCAGTTGWPGQPIEGVTPQLDENCDSDNDGVKNAQDAFPFDPSETLDTDLDGIGNNADPDDDNDGVPDADDSEPLDSNIGIIEYATFDIDQSGSVDALSDGLIILRYLFDFRGDSLINNAISPDANRTSSSEIEEYLDSHIN